MSSLEGLNFPIEIQDRFSTILNDFQKRIAAASAALAEFRAVASSTASAASAFVANSKAVKTYSAAMRDASRANKEFSRSQQQFGTKRALATAAKDAGLYAAKAKAAATATRQLAVETDKASQKMGLFQRISLRVLVGVAAYQALISSIRGFRNLIEAGVRFNQQIAEAQIGIAGVLAAVGQISDPFGNAVQGAKAFEIASRIAADQVQKLRVEALSTVATFDQLADAFQIAIAPGLAAGFSMDEIREFSVRISQAAAALGLTQNQLAEEVRSILTATIQPRNTRIATALGIDNATIRRLRESGQLAEFLLTQLEAFGTSGAEAARTLKGEFMKLKAVFETVAGAGLKTFSDRLKQTVVATRGSLLTGDLTNLQPNPRAEAAIRTLGDALSGVLDIAEDLATAIGWESIEGGARLLGNTLKTAATALSGFLQGVTNFGQTVNVLLDIVNNVFEALGPGLTRALGLLTQIIITTKIWGAVSALITKTWAGLAATVTAVGVTMQANPLVAAGGMILRFAGVAAALFGVNIALDAYTSSTTKAAEAQKKLLEGAGSLEEVLKRPDALREQRALIQKLSAEISDFEKDVRSRPFDPTAAQGLESQAVKDARRYRSLQDQLKAAQEELNRLLAVGAKEVSGSIRERLKFADETLDALTQELKLEKQKQAAIGDSQGIARKRAEVESGYYKQHNKELRDLELQLTRLRDADAQYAEQLAKTKVSPFTTEEFRAQQAKEQLRLAREQQAVQRNILSLEEHRATIEELISANTEEQLKDYIRQEERLARISNLENLREAIALKRRRPIFGAEPDNTQAQLIRRLEDDTLDLALAIAKVDEEMRGMEDGATLQALAFKMSNLKTEIGLVAEELQRVRDEGAFAFGLKTWADSVGDANQIWIDFASSAASELSTSLGDAFVDAFETGGKNAKQIFGNFLRSLASQLANSVFARLIADFIGAIGGGWNAAGGGVQGGIFAKGGKVVPHLWNLPGFAKGGHSTTGRVQKDPRDNILAFLRKGEFVMRPEAVAKFGEGFMEAINNLQSPPGLTDLLHSSKRSPPKRSFAMGGAVRNLGDLGPQRIVVQLPQVPAAILASEEYAEKFSSGRSGRKLREKITGAPTNRQVQENL